ncbi:MAG TPA: riboflavin synthase [Pirellulales bacterium]|nr:riboflavin synthase [Pirellulales bacterium]
MFTGLVEALATVVEVRPEPPGARISIELPQFTGADRNNAYENVRIGDSVALNGCCLTVVDAAARAGGLQLEFQAGEETLHRTNLGQLKSGSPINVEQSLCFGDRVGGHFVTGHIDGRGTLESRTDAGQWSTFWFRAPAELMRQMASKGSIAIDGVSLTLVDVEAERFSVMLIPHTLSVTTLGRLQPGDSVNLETDVLAKYVQKQLAIEANTAKPQAD